MNVPDNYSRYQLEEKRLYNACWICEYCGGGFTYDEMSEDLNLCETCYNEIKDFEEDENNEI